MFKYFPILMNIYGNPMTAKNNNDKNVNVSVVVII